MLEYKTYIGIICSLLVVKLLVMGFVEACDIAEDDNYQTECIMHDPPTPVEYESFYREGPIYIVIYEGHTRWSGEKCRERECVDVTEYRRAKSIIGGKIK